MNTPLHHITANIIEHDEFSTSVYQFRGIAFRDPVTGHWCALRTGLVLAMCLGDEVNILRSRPVRDSWQVGLQVRLPNRARKAIRFKSDALARYAATHNAGSTTVTA